MFDDFSQIRGHLCRVLADYDRIKISVCRQKWWHRPLPGTRCPVPGARCPVHGAWCPLPVAWCPVPGARCPVHRAKSVRYRTSSQFQLLVSTLYYSAEEADIAANSSLVLVLTSQSPNRKLYAVIPAWQELRLGSHRDSRRFHLCTKGLKFLLEHLLHNITI